MTVDIRAYITANFPRTEKELIDSDAVDYHALLETAIERAKREAYGTSTVPAEADLLDKVAEWIADKATLFLIPVGIEHYSLDRYIRRSNQQGEVYQRYNVVEMLKGLRDELEGDVAGAWNEVEALIGSSPEPTEVPAVSFDGLIIDPNTRALARGLP